VGDVILDKHDGSPDSLAIVDYKTAIDDRELGLQLQVYAAAGMREGLDVQGAFLHDMDKGERSVVDISPSAIEKALRVVTDAATGIKDRVFEPQPEISKCTRCDVRVFCRKSAK
jgi:DNA helicase-2/ATP-dependent DNA helicase PcrA